MRASARSNEAATKQQLVDDSGRDVRNRTNFRPGPRPDRHASLEPRTQIDGRERHAHHVSLPPWTMDGCGLCDHPASFSRSPPRLCLLHSLTFVFLVAVGEQLVLLVLGKALFSCVQHGGSGVEVLCEISSRFERLVWAGGQTVVIGGSSATGTSFFRSEWYHHTTDLPSQPSPIRSTRTTTTNP